METKAVLLKVWRPLKPFLSFNVFHISPQFIRGRDVFRDCARIEELQDVIWPTGFVTHTPALSRLKLIAQPDTM